MLVTKRVLILNSGDFFFFLFISGDFLWSFYYTSWCEARLKVFSIVS